MFYLFNCLLFVKIESKEGRKTAQFVILPEISKMKYQNRILERLFLVLPIKKKKKKKKKKNYPDRLTLDFFDM
jgi:hypothetical protein